MVIKLGSLEMRENLRRVTNERGRGRSGSSLHTRNKVLYTMQVYLWAIFRKYSKSSNLVLSKWIYLQEKGKWDIRWENFSRKDPSNYHSLTSVIWLYNTFGRKGEHRHGDKHKVSCQYPNLSRDYLLNMRVSHWSSCCSWLCSSLASSVKNPETRRAQEAKAFNNVKYAFSISIYITEAHTIISLFFSISLIVFYSPTEYLVL